MITKGTRIQWLAPMNKEPTNKNYQDQVTTRVQLLGWQSVAVYGTIMNGYWFIGIEATAPNDIASEDSIKSAFVSVVNVGGYQTSGFISYLNIIGQGAAPSPVVKTPAPTSNSPKKPSANNAPQDDSSKDSSLQWPLIALVLIGVYIARG